ncbi:MAG: AIPR family protein [Alphaproteobacteria bacterium]|nr:AIPR family protein [Alphaproteobacteria bacterium]
MLPDELDYANLSGSILGSYSYEGRTESASFLAWFIENILRLDDVEAADSICDGPSDRGIDAVYVDHDNSEVIFLQAKVRQNDARAIGDQPIRDFAGSVAQFSTPDLVEQALAAAPGSEIAKLLKRTDVAERLREGYSVASWFVTNAAVDENGKRAAEATTVTIFDRENIANRYVEIDAPDVVEGTAEFDVSDNGYVEFSAGDKAKLYLITAKAEDFLKLGGIGDGSLFAQNVRLSLGNTKVNKDIVKTVSDQSKHLFFPMYHNGITIICKKVEPGDKIKITDYVVVNGAQSLTVLNRHKSKVSDDLRLVAKIIEIEGDDAFAREITLASNNQNAIRPRDQRSTNLLQTRLEAEFRRIGFEGYSYVIKRGQDETGNAIINDEAGRLLMAYDVGEPWSCHQIYKVFDEKYTEVFGRPSVNAWRIILLTKMMEKVLESLNTIKFEPLQRYRLTRYFLLYAISRLLDGDEAARSILANPEALLKNAEKLTKFLETVRTISSRYCVDLRAEFVEAQDPPDYKAVLKSPTQVQEMEGRFRKSFHYDVARDREKMPSVDFI